MYPQPTRPADWHIQDWILALEAIVLYTRHSDDAQRCEHAERMIEEIAMDQGMLPSELLLQADDQFHRGHGSFLYRS
ncbi:hypothetical protein [Natronorarus salvus]|uniref:hypothetical protein n=1 Tax=Natronorarus salvus TaxID=3117733 RepID=UPI002F266DDA